MKMASRGKHRREAIIDLHRTEHNDVIADMVERLVIHVIVLRATVMQPEP